MLPALVLFCDRLLVKTAKKELRIPTDWAAAFSYRHRYVLSVFFLLLFVGFYFLQENTGIDFTLAKDDAVAEVFPTKNTIVILYENQDEENLGPVLESLTEDDQVSAVMGYSTTLGKAFTSKELSAILPAFADGLSIDPMMLEQLYAQFCPDGKEGRMTIETLFEIIQTQVLPDPRYSAMQTPEMREQLMHAQAALEASKAQFVSDQYSRLILTTTYPEESTDTTSFLNAFQRTAHKYLSGKMYLVGNSILVYEMQGGFHWEFLLITLLTALAIYLIVAISFRSLFVPLLLVLLVQCGVYITVTVTSVMSGGMYYLALLMVECILMGATIDYGILFTSYYRESRRSETVVGALKQAYAGSVHTILTSGLILVLITAAVGRLFEDRTVTEIVRTISIGSFCVLLLILFVLPGILAACDKLVKRK